MYIVYRISTNNVCPYIPANQSSKHTAGLQSTLYSLQIISPRFSVFSFFFFTAQLFYSIYFVSITVPVTVSVTVSVTQDRQDIITTSTVYFLSFALHLARSNHNFTKVVSHSLSLSPSPSTSNSISSSTIQKLFRSSTKSITPHFKVLSLFKPNKQNDQLPPSYLTPHKRLKSSNQAQNNHFRTFRS